MTGWVFEQTLALDSHIKVSSYAGKPSYKYLCASCERLEGFKKY